MLRRTDEPLARWTTLRLGGPATQFVEVTTRDELYEVVRLADAAGEPVLVMGGGSNLVVSDSGFRGTVVRVATAGVAVTADGARDLGSDDDPGRDLEPGGAEALVTAEAGENWDALVAFAVDEGWLGLEALSGIPGTVGAVPIQNVGAYGQEVAETVAEVHAFDRVEARVRTLVAADCGFGYRTSAFKRDPGRFVIGAVTFRLRPGSLGGPVRYAELARRLGVEVGSSTATLDVRRAVLDLRRGKGMVLDAADHDTWSVGSFFTNPFVDPAVLPPGAPSYAQPDGTVKTSAAWLIDRAGIGKGYGTSRVRLSSKHTLALTNRGTATTADLLELAAEVRDRVVATYGIVLDPEPTLVNCSL